MATNLLQRELKVLTDASRMRAFIRLSADENYSAVAESDLVHVVQTAKVVLNDRTRARIAELLALFKAGPVATGEFVLLEGVAPGEPKDAQFSFADHPAEEHPVEPEDQEESHVCGSLEHVNFFEQTRLHTAQEGKPFGLVTPAVPGTNGADVFGNPIKPAREPVEIELGENVELAEDGRTVVAKVSGRIHYKKNRLSVEPLIEIKGNVDFETGSIDAPTDVLIRGDVQDAFHVRSEKSVTVNGCVGCSEVKAAGDIHVRGGIAGKDKGRVEAQGQVVARFCNEADIHAGDDIVIAREALNSRLHTQGKIRMSRASLIGGYTYARGGGDVKAVGSEGDVRTQIAIGVDPAIFQRCHEIDEQVTKRREAAAKIRQAVQPLLAQLKRLMPAQRERATELMYEADQIDMGVQAMLDEKEAMLKKAAPSGTPFLFVAQRVFSGVTVIIGDRMTTFTEELRGPVRIERRRIDRMDEIVAVNELTGNVTNLGSRDFRLKIG